MNTGRIELITGPMFSSKTSTLMNRIERYQIAKKKCVILKWHGDTRYTSEPYIVSHGGLKMSCIMCSNETLKTIYDKISDYDIIGIDEGSFFKDIVSFCEFLAKKGHIVIVASLIGTYQREGFNDILNLIPKCEKYDMLTAVCMKCYKDAAFTKRIVDVEGIELIGTSKSYIAVCRNCFFKNTVSKII